VDIIFIGDSYIYGYVGYNLSTTNIGWRCFIYMLRILSGWGVGRCGIVDDPGRDCVKNGCGG
jgi:hypothetical protein